MSNMKLETLVHVQCDLKYRVAGKSTIIKEDSCPIGAYLWPGKVDTVDLYTVEGKHLKITLSAEEIKHEKKAKT